MSSFTTVFNILLEVPANSVTQDKKIKERQIGEKKLKLSFFTNDVVIYCRKSERTTKITPVMNQQLQQGFSIIYKNQVLFYILTMNNNWNLKSKPQYHLY